MAGVVIGDFSGRYSPQGGVAAAGTASALAVSGEMYVQFESDYSIQVPQL